MHHTSRRFAALIYLQLETMRSFENAQSTEDSRTYPTQHHVDDHYDTYVCDGIVSYCTACRNSVRFQVFANFTYMLYCLLVLFFQCALLFWLSWDWSNLNAIIRQEGHSSTIDYGTAEDNSSLLTDFIDELCTSSIVWPKNATGDRFLILRIISYAWSCPIIFFQPCNKHNVASYYSVAYDRGKMLRWRIGWNGIRVWGDTPEVCANSKRTSAALENNFGEKTRCDDIVLYLI